ncbi:hypothetical protein [Streptomyces ambofaciens]
MGVDDVSAGSGQVLGGAVAFRDRGQLDETSARAGVAEVTAE